MGEGRAGQERDGGHDDGGGGGGVLFVSTG